MSQDDQVLPAAAPAIAQDEVLLSAGPQSYSLPAVLSPPQIQLGTPASASDSLQDMLPSQLRHWQEMILHCSGRQFLWIYQVRVNYDNENRPYMALHPTNSVELPVLEPHVSVFYQYETTITGDYIAGMRRLIFRTRQLLQNPIDTVLYPSGRRWEVGYYCDLHAVLQLIRRMANEEGIGMPANPEGQFHFTWTDIYPIR